MSWTIAFLAVGIIVACVIAVMVAFVEFLDAEALGENVRSDSNKRVS